jgi:hypothetical protein
MKLATVRSTEITTSIVFNNGTKLNYSKYDYKRKETKRLKDISIDDVVAMLAQQYELNCVDFINGISSTHSHNRDNGLEEIHTQIPRGEYSYRRDEVIERLKIVVSIPENNDKIVKLLRNRIKYSSVVAKWELSLANHKCYKLVNGDADVIIIPNRNEAFVVEDGDLKMMDFHTFVKFVIETIERNKEKGNV